MIDKNIRSIGELLAEKRRITVVSHTNPDGDAIGAGLGLTKILTRLGHEVRFMVPNNYPYFLDWIDGIELIHIYKTEKEACDKFIAASDVVFCVDFNLIDRLEGLGVAIMANGGAKKVLIDHHPMPPEGVYDIMISDAAASSTSLLIYNLIVGLGAERFLDKSVAESLYVGISTDTGNFSFGNLSPELFRTVARLVECGIDLPKLNIGIYNNFSADRMRLMGYILDKKMKFTDKPWIAYMSLDAEEMKKYNFRQGDSEGFVNLPLSIKDVRMSVIFIEAADCIKVSLRSQGDIDVNRFARKYFNGGGHKNAAGGKYFGALGDCIAFFLEVIDDIVQNSCSK